VHLLVRVHAIRMSRKRSPNFIETELQTLLDEVEKRKNVLFSKLSNVTTNSAKKKAWDVICCRINAINPSDHRRTVEEIRKKWTSYMSLTKKKASLNRREARKTGGGPPPEDLSPLQDKVIGIIGETPIEGIDGGTDTCSVAEGSDTLTEYSASIETNEYGKSLFQVFAAIEKFRNNFHSALRHFK